MYSLLTATILIAGSRLVHPLRCGEAAGQLEWIDVGLLASPPVVSLMVVLADVHQGRPLHQVEFAL